MKAASSPAAHVAQSPTSTQAGSQASLPCMLPSTMQAGSNSAAPPRAPCPRASSGSREEHQPTATHLCDSCARVVSTHVSHHIHQPLLKILARQCTQQQPRHCVREAGCRC